MRHETAFIGGGIVVSILQIANGNFDGFALAESMKAELFHVERKLFSKCARSANAAVYAM